MVNYPINIPIPSHLVPAANLLTTHILPTERSNATFSPTTLQSYLFTPELIARTAELLAILQSDPTGVFDKRGREYESRLQLYERGARKDKRIAVLQQELGWTAEDVLIVDDLVSQRE